MIEDRYKLILEYNRNKVNFEVHINNYTINKINIINICDPQQFRGAGIYGAKYFPSKQVFGSSKARVPGLRGMEVDMFRYGLTQNSIPDLKVGEFGH